MAERHRRGKRLSQLRLIIETEFGVALGKLKREDRLDFWSVKLDLDDIFSLVVLCA